jgi:hypothetical protein
MKYNKINIIDDKLIQHEPVVKMYRGAESCSNMVITPVGGVLNQSQLVWNIPCTPSNYFDRRPMIKTTFTVPVTCKNTSAGTNVAQGAALTVPGTDVTMSAYPASNLFGNCEVSINGNQIGSYDMGKYASTVLKLSNVSKNMKKTTCASCPETSFASIDDANFTLSNSQGNFNDSTNEYIPNGSWTFNNVTNNTVVAANLIPTGTQVVNYIIESYEPLILPPFIWNSHNDSGEGIFGMNGLLITLNVNQSSAVRAVRTLGQSIINPTGKVALSVVGPVVINACELHYKTYRPPALVDFKLPSPYSIFHTYNFYTNFVSSVSAFTAVNVANEITMSNLVSTGMPSLIVLWCDKPANLYASNQAKYSYPISNITVDLGTTQNMLSNYDITDLYRLSEEAGLNQSFLSYIGQAYTIAYDSTGAVVLANAVAAGATKKQLVGGPIILRPGISFPLPAEIATNSSGSYTWKFTAKCSTINTADSTTVTPILNLLMLYDNWVSIDTTTLECKNNKNFLTVPEVLGMSRSEAVPLEDTKNESGGALSSHDMVRMSGFKSPSKLSSRVRKN